MGPLYPLMVDLKGKSAVVVGGGRVAARKVKSLLEVGAQVTIISPVLDVELTKEVEAGNADWKRQWFSPEVLHEAWVVVAATNDRDVNAQVARAAGDRRLVNVVDQPELGNCHFPAYLRRGRLTLAVSTGGASPRLAQQIRDGWKKEFDDTWTERLEQLYRERRKRRGRRQ
ncbi:precorrin-2 dehydrogenase/sirohydrochlorin ferrochelatase family protein [Desmospora profundinema]|uniref:precorrin-2 dehydrogenase n=1 Tax=Desmospora profundinema TaxID=1571184 RepID=A0ABU1IPG3_9BACL|nr:NAD(P)-dependent oxidoreductase [Desmospora profundinema]MDR6226628.1 precorrin-2 dehydrogenase/sirohydrochlorin ferrochelatase [Desmospora profundinema]